MRLTIGKKIYMTVLGLVGIFLVVCLITFWNLQTLKTHINQLVEQKIPELADTQYAATQLIQARRAEKDFMLRLDPTYIEIVDKSVGRTIEHLTDAQTHQSSDHLEKLKHAVQLTQIYHENFKKVAELITKRGLSEKEGLRGAMREAIHHMEDRLKKFGDKTLMVEMLMCRRHEKDYLLRGTQKYVDKLQARVASCRDIVANMKVSEEDAKLINNDLDVYLATFMNLANNDKVIAETSQVFREATREAFDLVEALAENSHDEVPKIEKAMMSMINGVIRVLLIAMITGLVVASIVSLVMSNRITRPIKPIVKRAQEIAAGDLRGEQLTCRSNDELGDLTDAINKMEKDLKHVLHEIHGTIAKVSESSSEMSSTAEFLSQNAGQQATNTSSVAAAVEELSSTINEVAHQCSDAATSAQQAGRSATDGGKVVEQTVNAMQTISDAVHNTAKAMQELSDRSQAIGQIIDVINDIADQTNLLALNAAIEAARAGDAGRGFAVVADEVRKLAERTTVATQEVADSITAIQRETENAATKMHEGTEIVSTGVDYANKAGQSLQDILKGSDHVASMVTSIASAAEEQSLATRQIAQNVENINAGANQAQASSENTSLAANNLSKLSTDLQNLIYHFRIS